MSDKKIIRIHIFRKVDTLVINEEEIKKLKTLINMPIILFIVSGAFYCYCFFNIIF
jgi:hypothetical protein